MTVIALQRAVEADREAQMCARRELELRVPEEVRGLFSETCRAVREVEARWVSPAACLLIVARHFIETWKEALKLRNTARNRATMRDRGLCTVPGCSRAGGHSHHITPRSQGGSDEEWNRTSTCPPHHLHGIHLGYVRVRGRAPDRLVWELGEVG
jgi:5-methylcytosine-specific restriction endonuclease McrA